MHFKKLQISGFKSFADRTVVSFGEGLTVVVGPNGCGKSNISDAVRWALGEQSAKDLRGTKMEDIIFNGTDLRPALNMAEVSITLSNESKNLPIEYDEVIITRRIYRSGESEYLLNKNQVRLKDITELLAGTGIGVDSYSVMEQGKIDSILSSKPEERRVIFEEASGISKFKSKKREALRKLKHTEDNLLRVSDIIHEVKRQINSIERHAKKAERYKKLFDELKDLEIKNALYACGRLNETAASSENEILKIKDTQEETQKSIVSAKSLIESKEKDLQILQDKISSLEKNSLEKISAIDKKRHTIATNEERAKELFLLREKLEREVIDLEEKVKSLTQEVEAVRQKLSSEIAKRGDQNELTLKAKNNSDDIINAKKCLEEELEKIKEGVAEIESRILDKKNNIIRLKSNVENNRIRLNQLSKDDKQMSSEFERIQVSEKKISTEINLKESDISELFKSLHEAENQEEEKKSLLSEIRSAISSKEHEEVMLSSNINMLSDLIKKHEGFSAGAKKILKSFDDGTLAKDDVCGLLCDIISADEGYEELIEKGLGNNLESLVVESDDAAHRIYRYAQDHSIDNLKVISIEAVNRYYNEFPNKKFDLGSSEITSLKDKIAKNEKYTTLFEYLFGHIVLTKSYEESEEILKKYPHITCIKAKEYMRDYISCQAISGDNQNVSLVGRANQLEKLTKSLELAKQFVLQKQGEENLVHKEVDSLEEVILDIRRQHQAKQIELAHAEARKESINKEHDWFKNEKKIVEKETQQLNIQINHDIDLEKAEKAKIDALDEELLQQQLYLREKQDEIIKKDQEKEKALIEQAELNSQLEYVQGQVDHLNSHVYRIDGFLDDHRKQIVENKNQIAEIGIKSEEITHANQIYVKEISATEDQVNQINLTLKEDSFRRNEESQSLIKIRESLSQLDQKLGLLKDEQHDMNIKGNQVDFERNSIKERIKQLYRTDLDLIENVSLENFDLDGSKVRIEELTKKTEKIGTVNLVAIEEHKELQERLTFLTTQFDDLAKAKEDLSRTIRKINATTKDLFLSTFNNIKQEFRNYFRILFGGGQADIILQDETDVLECGIDIVARPPGKKLQNISLLSGGERAMTAIALLFAVFKTKPSPFCILDELDAPLDESNIDRFNKVLEDFVKISQFIIISHNRKTIQYADAIYGVTMEEKGVSKIVSVRFKDQENARPREDLIAT